jgi:hypothetical protein
MNVNMQANDRHFSAFYVACLMNALILLSEPLKRQQDSKIFKGILAILFVGMTTSYSASPN